MTQYDAEILLPSPQESEPPKHLGRTLVLDLAIVLLIMFIAVLAAQILIVAIRAPQQGINLSNFRNLDENALLRLIGVDGIVATLVLQNAIFIAIPIIRTKLFQRTSLRQIGFHAEHPLRLLAFGIGLGIITLLGNAMLGILFAQAGIRQNQSAQYPLFQGDYLGQFVFFIGAALLAPLGEEILFRGYVFNTLRRMWNAGPGALIAAYAISALLFALAHSLAATQGLIALLVPAFFMGLVLAWGMHRTGSIIPCFIAHSMNNSLALVALVTCINNPGMCPNI